MKTLLFLSLFLFSASGICQTDYQYCGYESETKSLGIGLIIAPTQYTLFSDSSLSKVLVKKNMYQDAYESSQICAKFSKSDYGIMHFVCLERGARFQKILYNGDKIAYVPRSKRYPFKSWSRYIMDAYGTAIKMDLEKSNPFRIEPNSSAQTIKVPEGHQLYCPIRLNGDWLYVQLDCFYNSDELIHEGEPCQSYINECGTGKRGWIRWRKRNQLLIEIYLMP